MKTDKSSAVEWTEAKWFTESTEGQFTSQSSGKFSMTTNSTPMWAVTATEPNSTTEYLSARDSTMVQLNHTANEVTERPVTGAHFSAVMNTSFSSLPFVASDSTTRIQDGFTVPQTTVTTTLGEVHAMEYRTGLGCIMCAVLVIALCGNLLVLLAITRTRSLRRLNNYLIVSLAVSDFLFALLCMPLFITELFHDYTWILPTQLCPIYVSLEQSFVFLSVWNIAAISLERVFLIVQPMMYQRLVSEARMLAFIAALWVISIAYGMSQIYWFNREPYLSWSLQHPDFCRYLPPEEYAITDFVVCFLLPLCIMLGAYQKIYCIVQSQMSRIHPTMSDAWDELDIPSDLLSTNQNIQRFVSQMYKDSGVSSANREAQTSDSKRDNNGFVPDELLLGVTNLSEDREPQTPQDFLISKEQVFCFENLPDERDPNFVTSESCTGKSHFNVSQSTLCRNISRVSEKENAPDRDSTACNIVERGNLHFHKIKYDIESFNGKEEMGKPTSDATDIASLVISNSDRKTNSDEAEYHRKWDSEEELPILTDIEHNFGPLESAVKDDIQGFQTQNVAAVGVSVKVVKAWLKEKGQLGKDDLVAPFECSSDQNWTARTHELRLQMGVGLCSVSENQSTDPKNYDLNPSAIPTGVNRHNTPALDPILDTNFNSILETKLPQNYVRVDGPQHVDKNNCKLFWSEPLTAGSQCLVKENLVPIGTETTPDECLNGESTVEISSLNLVINTVEPIPDLNNKSFPQTNSYGQEKVIGKEHNHQRSQGNRKMLQKENVTECYSEIGGQNLQANMKEMNPKADHKKDKTDLDQEIHDSSFDNANMIGASIELEIPDDSHTLQVPMESLMERRALPPSIRPSILSARCASEPRGVIERTLDTGVQISISRASSRDGLAAMDFPLRRVNSARPELITSCEPSSPTLTSFQTKLQPVLKSSQKHRSTSSIPEVTQRKRNSVVFRLEDDDVFSRDGSNAVQTHHPKLHCSSSLEATETSASGPGTTETTFGSDSHSGYNSSKTKRNIQSRATPTSVWAKQHFNVSHHEQSTTSVSAGAGRGSARSRGGSGASSRRSNLTRRLRDNKAIRMTAAVIGAFMFCILPYKIVFLMRVRDVGSVSDFVWNIVTAIMFCANALNPFIYNFYNSTFRVAIKRLLTCKRISSISPF